MDIELFIPPIASFSEQQPVRHLNTILISIQEEQSYTTLERHSLASSNLGCQRFSILPT